MRWTRHGSWTRARGLGASESKVGPHSSITLTVAGADSGALPKSGMTAVSLHVTAVDAAAGGFVAVYPDGEEHTDRPRT